MQNVKCQSTIVYFANLYWKVLFVISLSCTSGDPDASSPWEGDFSVFDNLSPRFVSWGRFPAQLLSSAPVKGGWSCFAATYCFPWRRWGAGWGRWRSPMSGRSSDFSSAKSSPSHLLVVLQLQLFKLLLSSVYFNISSASCSSTFLQQGFLQLLIGKGEFLNCFHYYS